jgi:hypothetical protein
VIIRFGAVARPKKKHTNGNNRKNAIRKTTGHAFAIFLESVKNLGADGAAWAGYVEAKTEQSLAVLRAIAESEESAGNERPATPIPAREMLADMLLEKSRPRKRLSNTKWILDSIQIALIGVWCGSRDGNVR